MSWHPITIIDMHSGIPIPEVPIKLWAEVQEVARSQRKHDHHYYHHYHQHLKPFNDRTLSHKTHFWPKSFCTRNVSHQRPLDHKPITPEALYTRSCLWCQKPLAPEGCTPKVFTSERLLLSGQNLLHHKHLRQQLWHQKTFTLYTKRLLHRSPLYQNPLHTWNKHIQCKYNASLECEIQQDFAHSTPFCHARHNKDALIQCSPAMQNLMRLADPAHPGMQNTIIKDIVIQPNCAMQNTIRRIRADCSSVTMRCYAQEGYPVQLRY